MRLPILVLHITAGTLGMLSGFVTVFLRKGSRRHSIAGDVFVISMLTMAVCGVYLAIMKSQPGNVLGGTLTIYLVATAWMTARRRDSDEETGLVDWGALILVSAVAAADLTFGIEAVTSPSGLKYAYPPGPYFMLGSVASIAAIGDLRMLARHGISGSQRLARHLWRMCFALFIAASSIFLARQQIFPALLRTTGTLWFLSVLPLLLMIIWLLRVNLAKTYKHSPKPARTHPRAAPHPQPQSAG